MKYGDLPTQLGQFEIHCKEMLFYQYLPIKLQGQTALTYEERLRCFDDIVGAICCDFIGEYGLDRYVNSFAYLTVKYMYQSKNCSYNRQGYHTDGFLTDDINYIWCDKNPTIFNRGDFNLTADDHLSLAEMEHQAMNQNEVVYRENELLRLNQFNVHKVNDHLPYEGMRTFLKLSFSTDKYDLIGNSHNYLLDYNWEMRERTESRNIPQALTK